MNRFYFAAFVFVSVLNATVKSAVSAEQAQAATEQTLIAPALYPDVPREHWASQAVHRASANGLVEGHPDGLFRGEQALTRYEFPVALARMLNVDWPADFYTRFRWKSLDELEKDRLFPSSHSKDVPRGHYAYEAVRLVQRLGIMQGNADSEFLGDKPLTRYEYVTALIRLLELKRYAPK